MYNREVVLLISSAKSHNYKYKTSKIDQKILTNNLLNGLRGIRTYVQCRVDLFPN